MKRSYIIAFWSPFPISSTDFCMDFFAPFLKKHEAIECVNCRHNTDRRTMNLMKQADLVVIVFRQCHRDFCNWFCQSACHFTNSIYMVIDYFPAEGADLKSLIHEFRIPSSRLICIPHNGEYFEAVRHGHARHYWENADIREKTQAQMDFHRELERSAWRILKALGL